LNEKLGLGVLYLYWSSLGYILSWASEQSRSVQPIYKTKSV